MDPRRGRMEGYRSGVLCAACWVLVERYESSGDGEGWENAVSIRGGGKCEASPVCSVRVDVGISFPDR